MILSMLEINPEYFMVEGSGASIFCWNTTQKHLFHDEGATPTQPKGFLECSALKS